MRDGTVRAVSRAAISIVRNPLNGNINDAHPLRAVAFGADRPISRDSETDRAETDWANADPPGCAVQPGPLPSDRQSAHHQTEPGRSVDTGIVRAAAPGTGSRISRWP